MTKSEYDLACIEYSQQQFQKLLQCTNHDELVDCLKLLAMYIALYKKNYGEIAVEDFTQMLKADGANGELSEIIQEGIEEASAMLDMIITERQEQLIHKESPSSYIN